MTHHPILRPEPQHTKPTLTSIQTRPGESCFTCEITIFLNASLARCPILPAQDCFPMDSANITELEFLKSRRMYFCQIPHESLPNGPENQHFANLLHVLAKHAFWRQCFSLKWYRYNNHVLACPPEASTREGECLSKALQNGQSVACSLW